MTFTKFQVNWPFRSGKEAKNRFSRWLPWWWQPSWISDWNDFGYFWSTSHPYASKSVSSQFGSGEEAKNRFSTGTTCILAIIDLQVTLTLPTTFQVHWTFGSGEEVKNRFSRLPASWISDLNDFSYFWSTSHPDASYRVSSQLAFRFRKRRREK